MSPDTGPLEFEILGRIFVAPMKTTNNGKISWRFPDNDQSSAGIDLEPWDNSLPAHLKVANTKYEFGPVPRRGADRSDNQTKFKSFSKAREVRTKASFGERRIDIHCRITAKKDGNWYLWLRADPIRGSVAKPALDNQGARQTSSDEDTLKKLLLGK